MLRYQILVAAVLIVSCCALSTQAVPALGNQVETATPVASPSAVSCTVWAQDGGYGVNAPGGYPQECTISEPWWNAWETCDITPVHAERFAYPRPWDQQLNGLPWIVADSDQVELVGHLFYGNRPLIAGGYFARDGVNAKLLWQFGEPVELKSITGINLWESSQSATIRFSVANSNDAISNEFPSMMDFPSGGCWETTLAGTTEAGIGFSATVTFIVIDK